mmetsp:Transcript_5643/g.8922  ORF Transcript_5643/g.8922 Transcript_5643/m.8922 type:complete len:130 (+) Transcript_5643:890-1279(+)
MNVPQSKSLSVLHNGKSANHLKRMNQFDFRGLDNQPQKWHRRKSIKQAQPKSKDQALPKISDHTFKMSLRNLVISLNEREIVQHKKNIERSISLTKANAFDPIKKEDRPKFDSMFGEVSHSKKEKEKQL